MATAPLPQPSLLEQVEAYIARYHLADSQFGQMVNREPALVSTLRKGRQCRERVQQAILAFIAKPPPSGARRGTRIAILYRKAVAEGRKCEAAARLHRATDPVELAKAHLQRRGYRVFSVAVLDPSRSGWAVGTKPDPLDDNALKAMARRLGWQG